MKCLQFVDVLRVEFQNLQIAFNLHLALLPAEAALELEGEGGERDGSLELQGDPLGAALQRRSQEQVTTEILTWSEFQQVSLFPSNKYFFPNCFVSLLRVLLTRQVYWVAPPHSRGLNILKVDGLKVEGRVE